VFWSIDSQYHYKVWSTSIYGLIVQCMLHRKEVLPEGDIMAKVKLVQNIWKVIGWITDVDVNMVITISTSGNDTVLY
jgi:hypothetical protein